MRQMEFFLVMDPPRVTAQEHSVTMAGGRPRFFDPPRLKAARADLTARLVKKAPEKMFSGPIELVVTWCFPHGRHKPNTYKTTRPDTDNLEKLLKDCMTAAGYWQDDALVVREIVEKYWTEVPGIRIRVSEL